MIKRIKKWILFKLIKYIPSTSHLADIEAKRIINFIVENYNEHNQILLLEELRKNLIEYRKQQIEEKEILIDKEKKILSILKANLEKLDIQ